MVGVEVAGTHFHAERCHESHGLYFGPSGFGTPRPRDGGGVEVRRVVFGEHFAFRHDVLGFGWKGKGGEVEAVGSRRPSNKYETLCA